MDAILSAIGMPFSVAVVIALAVVVAAFIYLGPKAAKIVGGLALLLLAVFAIRKDAKDDAKTDQLKEDLENETTRNDEIVRADRAGDAAGSVPADRLREHDPFEIK